MRSQQVYREVVRLKVGVKLNDWLCLFSWGKLIGALPLEGPKKERVTTTGFHKPAGQPSRYVQRDGWSSQEGPLTC